MSLFNYDKLRHITQALDRAYEKVKSYNKVYDLAQKDVITLLVKAEHRGLIEALVDECGGFVAPDYVGTVYHVKPIEGFYQAIPQKEPNLLFQLQEKLEYLLPRYTQLGICQDAPEHLKSRIDTWVERQVTIEAEHTLFRHALSYFNDECETVRDMRFYFPSLQALIKDAINYQEKTGLDGALKQASMAPKLPNKVIPLDEARKKALHRCNTFMARASLLAKHNTAKAQVNLGLARTRLKIESPFNGNTLDVIF